MMLFSRENRDEKHSGSSRRWAMFFFATLLIALLPSCEPELATKTAKSEPPREVSKAIFDEKPVSTDEAPAPPAGKSQSSIHALLVTHISDSAVAGSTAKLNAIVMDDDLFGETILLEFNQDVGESMEAATREVEKFHLIRNKGAKLGKRIEIGFEEHYSSKDGPSGALACALLVESILTGAELADDFAVTGDLSAAGTVQPVGGIDGKIRGATKGGCKIIAIPGQNASALSDLSVLDEMNYFINIQIFSVSNFDDALAVAKIESQRDPALDESIRSFAEIQKIMMQPGGTKWIGNAHVQERLQKILSVTPNHESAKHLYLKGAGKTGNMLSLRGSFLQIFKATQPVREALNTGILPEATDSLSGSIFALRRIRTKLDPRTRACADSLGDFSEVMKKLGDTNLSTARTRLPGLVDSLNESWERVIQEYRKIESDPEIQEELNL